MEGVGEVVGGGMMDWRGQGGGWGGIGYCLWD